MQARQQRGGVCGGFRQAEVATYALASQGMGQLGVMATGQNKLVCDAGVPEEDGSGTEHVRNVRQAGPAFRDRHQRRVRRLAGDPLSEGLPVGLGQGVPDVRRQFVGSEAATVAATALFLFLDLDDPDLAEVCCRFTIELVAEAFALGRRGDAQEFEHRQVQSPPVGLAQFPRQWQANGGQLGGALRRVASLALIIH